MLSSTSSWMRRVSTVPEKPLSLTSITVSPIDSTFTAHKELVEWCSLQADMHASSKAVTAP